MRLAAPSFILPAQRLENVQYLQGLVDEVQLLYFCSQQPEDFPDEMEVAALAREPINYNVHLPYDRSLHSPDSWEVMGKFLHSLQPLQASTHTLHLQPEIEFFHLLEKFAAAHTAGISVENGGNDAHLFAEAQVLPVDFCVDVGHLIHHGQEVEAVLQKYQERIVLLHLHGSDGQRDHQGLQRVDRGLLRLVKDFAQERGVTICLEIFQEQVLRESIALLQEA
ncbi:cobamide remodeling phosphodiesterase CbiR [Desulfurispira natronophila]|uniref:Sugar phosphate isomerase/epimerase n=1 Tax=Desulfurispira natronophila TaxID=682562 RepID=A0A7W8DHI8_9BACT|nr:cobamide remodeling phosphodiesterase CbiR [Desulfurispira natronophila]MBB5022530.1 sugar phosphate isomerase/epimerase [Desulfurispira natronophila]